MKKLFFLLAVAGLTSFAACKSGETKVEATADTTAPVEAAVADTAVLVSDTAVAQ